MKKLFTIFFSCIINAVVAKTVSEFSLLNDTSSVIIQDLSQKKSSDSISFDSISIESISVDSIDESSTFPNIMRLESAPYQNLSQGGACFGKYLVIGVSWNRCFNIYDLENKQLVCSVPIHEPKPSRNCHSNTICFGNQFFSIKDRMPILYVCSGYGDSEKGQSHIYVYRLVCSKEKPDTFEAVLIQDITFAFPGWTECVVDNDKGYLWVRRYINNNQIDLLKFYLPDYRISKITLYTIDAIDTIQTYNFIAQKNTQGFVYHNNHIYYVNGTSGRGKDGYLIDFNLDKRDYERVTYLYDLEIGISGTGWEPEFVFFYKDELYIGYRAFICKPNIELLNQSHNYITLFNRIYNK